MILKQYPHIQVPVIMGCNSDEGAFNVIGYLKGKVHFDDIESKWDQLGPLILFHRSLDEISPEDVQLAHEVKDF